MLLGGLRLSKVVLGGQGSVRWPKVVKSGLRWCKVV